MHTLHVHAATVEQCRNTEAGRLSSTYVHVHEGTSAYRGWLKFGPKFSFALFHISPDGLVEQQLGSSQYLHC
jgi:hypothetical protein